MYVENIENMHGESVRVSESEGLVRIGLRDPDLWVRRENLPRVISQLMAAMKSKPGTTHHFNKGIQVQCFDRYLEFTAEKRGDEYFTRIDKPNVGELCAELQKIMTGVRIASRYS